MAIGSLTASTYPAAVLSASTAAPALLTATTGAGTPGGYPATYGPVYPSSTGALILTGSTAP